MPRHRLCSYLWQEGQGLRRLSLAEGALVSNTHQAYAVVMATAEHVLARATRAGQGATYSRVSSQLPLQESPFPP